MFLTPSILRRLVAFRWTWFLLSCRAAVNQNRRPTQESQKVPMKFASFLPDRRADMHDVLHQLVPIVTSAINTNNVWNQRKSNCVSSWIVISWRKTLRKGRNGSESRVENCWHEISGLFFMKLIFLFHTRRSVSSEQNQRKFWSGVFLRFLFKMKTWVKSDLLKHYLIFNVQEFLITILWCKLSSCLLWISEKKTLNFGL